MFDVGYQRSCTCVAAITICQPVKSQSENARLGFQFYHVQVLSVDFSKICEMTRNYHKLMMY